MTVLGRLAKELKIYSILCQSHRVKNSFLINHFLLHCPQFHADRMRVFVAISLLGNFEISCSSLLHVFDDFDLQTNKNE